MLRTIRYMSAAVLLAVPVLAGLAPAQIAKQPSKDEKAIERAMRAMFGRRTAHKLRILTHDFNVYPAKVTVRRNGWVIMTGRISHHLRWRPDDQTEYTIKKKDGVVQVLEVKHKAGGLSKWVRNYGKYVNPAFASGPLGKALFEAMRGTGWYLDENFSPVLRGQGWTSFKRNGKTVSGDSHDGWEGAASLVVTIAALRLDEKGRDALNPPREARPRSEKRDGRGRQGRRSGGKSRRRDLRGRPRWRRRFGGE